MFKKKCPRCKEKISKQYNYCPYCNQDLNSSNDDFGMLGKNDAQNKPNQFGNPFIGNLNGKILNKMIGNVMGMLEKEMNKEMSQKPLKNQPNIRIMLNGKEIKLNNQQAVQKKQPIKKHLKSIPNSKLPKKDFKGKKNLPKEEPSTNIRRMTDKIIYEINLPEVKSIKDISITKLENSIEIKALAKTKIFLKRISINLPIIDFNFSKEKLTLELEAKN